MKYTFNDIILCLCALMIAETVIKILTYKPKKKERKKRKKNDKV